MPKKLRFSTLLDDDNQPQIPTSFIDRYTCYINILTGTRIHLENRTEIGIISPMFDRKSIIGKVHISTKFCSENLLTD